MGAIIFGSDQGLCGQLNEQISVFALDHIKEAGVKLRLALNIAKLPDGKFSCSMVSLDQGAAEVPASAIQYAPPNIRVEWSSIGAAYNGKLENGKLTGAFRQGGAAFPLMFERTQ